MSCLEYFEQVMPYNNIHLSFYQFFMNLYLLDELILFLHK